MIFSLYFLCKSQILLQNFRGRDWCLLSLSLQKLSWSPTLAWYAWRSWSKRHQLFVGIFSVWPAQRSPFRHRRNAQLAGGNLTWEVSTVFTFLISSNNLQSGFLSFWFWFLPVFRFLFYLILSAIALDNIWKQLNMPLEFIGNVQIVIELWCYIWFIEKALDVLFVWNWEAFGPLS